MSAWTIAKREIKSLFVSPVAYVVLGIFAFISGIHFLITLTAFDEALQQYQIQAQLMRNPEAMQGLSINELLISNVISFAFFLLLFALPAITMRLLSEERNQGTYELLLTSPATSWDIVLGKFFAGEAFFLALLATHALFLLVMFGFGNPEPGPMVSGYLGLFLGGSAFLAVGLFASSLTKNQIIAFFVALFINLVLLMIGWAASKAGGHMSDFLQNASINFNFDAFNKGMISVSGLVYFLTLMGFFIIGSQVAVQSLTRR